MKKATPYPLKERKPYGDYSGAAIGQILTGTISGALYREPSVCIWRNCGATK